MKRLFALLALCAIFARSSVHAQNADDQYVHIYGLIQQGDAYYESRHPKEALAVYLEADAALKKFQKSFPAWNNLVVGFRTNYLAGQISDVKAKYPQLVGTAPPVTQPVQATPASGEMENRLRSLQNQVSILEGDKQLLEAKLKESFAAQPAAVDPRELAKAEENVRTLQKENELLKASLAKVQPSVPNPADQKAIQQLKQQLADSNRKLSDATDKAAKLESARSRDLADAEAKVKSLQKDNDQLKAGLAQAQAGSAKSGDTKVVEQLKQQLADSNRKLNDATDKAAKLESARARELADAEAKVKSVQRENDQLKTGLAQAQAGADKSGDTKAVEQLKQQLADSNRKLTEATDRAARLAAERKATPTPSPVQITRTGDQDVAAALRAENELIKKQLAQLQMPSTNSTNPDDVGRQLAQARAEVAALQSDTEILRLEKMALATRAAHLSAPPVNTAAITAPPPVDADTRVQQLAKERDELQRKLNATRNQLASAKNQGATTTTTPDAPVPVDELKAKVEVLEAPAVPYTPEELALFKQPPPALADPSTAAKEFAAETTRLLAEAKQMFEAKNYEKAEADYLLVLKRDPKNVFVLANVAAIEIEMNHLDDAEKHVQQALAVAPADAYSLSVLGSLRFRQEKYDDALSALSQAAQISPQSPEIQNLLGVTLSHKGLRAQAETALRKAIQLDPKYGGAHNNLAVIYLAQQPPYVELARWHYQKALAAGFPHNPDLEKELDAKTVTQ